MSQLLVSVRTAAEARRALVAGAQVVDVKEPSRGSLGRPDAGTVRSVLKVIGGRIPVSAALGELADEPVAESLVGLQFAKWGLAGCATRGLHARLVAAAGQLQRTAPGTGLVLVAYADAGRATAPTADALLEVARDLPAVGILIDTWQKDGTTLLDWLTPAQLRILIGRSREAGLTVALAGSLGVEHIRTLLPLAPDWFAVRGAVCRGRSRLGTLDPARVRQLARLIQSGHARHAG